MKNLSVVLNIILLIAIGILYFFHFSSHKTEMPGEDIRIIKDTSEVNSGKGMSIVYINIDSLLDKYQLSKKLNDKILNRKNNFSAELERKAQALQKEYLKFQEKYQRGGFLTQQSLESEQRRLFDKEQDLKQFEYDLTNKFIKEQQDLTIQLHDSISNFLKEFNCDKQYHFIISHAFGGNLLYADEALDITDTIISVLNERYSNHKSLEKDK